MGSSLSVEALGPMLRGRRDGDDLDDLAAHAVGNDVARISDNQLARAVDAAGSPHAGLLRKMRGCPVDATLHPLAARAGRLTPLRAE